MPKDTFFDQKTCDRCGRPLDFPGGSSRTMSWFTEETICTDVCAMAEGVIKQALRAKGVEGAMEGCGFVPVVIGRRRVVQPEMGKD